MKKYNHLTCLLITLLFLVSCQDVRKGFSGKKIDQGNEFLVIKKNPLVVPPNFNEMPEPKNKNKITEKGIIKNSNLKSDFENLIKNKETNKKELTSKENSSSLEEKILGKIK
jgi:PBP1b-binding outer membrane lipoprotein LpoB